MLRAAPADAPLQGALRAPNAGDLPLTNGRRMRIEMGTAVVIEALSPSATLGAAAMEAAFAAVRQVAQRLHPQAGESDLRQINTAAVGTVVPLWSGTLEVLRFARDLHRLSAGVFDPCLPERPGRLADLELIEGPLPAAIAHAPLTLDCGGIAKGYAVDRAIGALHAAGCAGGLVNAGGDLRVFGAARWPLLLRRPQGDYQPFELIDAALAASEVDARRRPSGHRGYYLRASAAAAVGCRYAAVRSATAMTADALTKCVLLCGAEFSRRLLEQLGSERLA
jgi:FAD:protein FMN transferase